MILESARSGLTKTKIMYKSYLSYEQVIQYLEYLTMNDLLVFDEKSKLYTTSERGLKVLHLQEEIKDIAPGILEYEPRVKG